MTSHAVYKIISKTGTIVFSQDTDFWIATIKGLSTKAAVSATQYAGQVGSTVNTLSIPEKKITITGTISGNVELHRRQLQDAMPPSSSVRLEIIDNQTTWYINGFVEQSPDVADGSVLQGFQLAIYCAYPYFKQADVSYQLAGLIPLFHTPFFTGGEWSISGFSLDLFKHIPNTGNLEMAFKTVFYARAKVVRPSIYNAEKSSYIKTTITLNAGESITISTIDADKDAGNSVVYTTAAGISSNGYRYIAPGSDLAMTISPKGNVMAAIADEHIENLNCTVISAGGERHSI